MGVIAECAINLELKIVSMQDLCPDNRMYLGKVVETTPYDVFRKSLHPYTFALVSAVPIPDPQFSGRAQILSGEVPSPISPPPGCRFYPRCIFAQDVCKMEDPELRDVGDGHLVACHFAGELDFGKSAQMEYADSVNGSIA